MKTVRFSLLESGVMGRHKRSQRAEKLGVNFKNPRIKKVAFIDVTPSPRHENKNREIRKEQIGVCCWLLLKPVFQ